MMLMLWSTAAGGCQRGGGQAATPNSQSRIREAAVIGARGQDAPLDRLVELLDDEDLAVRYEAQRSLYRATGADLGYHYALTKEQRRESVDRWREFSAERNAMGQNGRTPPPQTTGADTAAAEQAPRP